MTSKKKDWRSLPRKPAGTQRIQRGFRVSPAELERLRANAAAAEMTVNDFIRQRCCQPPGPYGN